MKLINKDTDYALQALLYMGSHPDKRLSADELATECTVPVHFLRKILSKLRDADIVVTHHGAGGGSQINKPTESITLAEVVTLFQGPVQATECMFRKQVCKNRSSCVLRCRLLKIEGVIKHELQEIAISDLLNDMKGVSK